MTRAIGMRVSASVSTTSNTCGFPIGHRFGPIWWIPSNRRSMRDFGTLIHEPSMATRR
jgi:hypothetical protein